MRTITALATIIVMASLSTGHALDLDQMRARERSRFIQPVQPAGQQRDYQSYAATKDRQRYEIQRGQDNISARSQLPLVETVSIELLTAQTGTVQPAPPATYQYQPLQTLTTQKVDSLQTEDNQPEKPVDEEPAEQMAETVVEAETHSLEEATEQELTVAQTAEESIEYQIIEEHNRIVVLQVEPTRNRQTQ